jgi:hypothetical protein
MEEFHQCSTAVPGPDQDYSRHISADCDVQLAVLSCFSERCILPGIVGDWRRKPAATLQLVHKS